MDFVIGQVSSVLHLPDGQVKFFLEEIQINYRSTVEDNFFKFLINSCGLKSVFQAYLTK